MTIATAHLADSQHPWIGLASFTEGDREFFAGRGEEIDELLRLVRRDLLTLLYGVSGLGKTSLLQAGLFPALRTEDCLPVPIRLDYREGAAPLSAQVLGAITAAADAAQVEAPKPRPDETLWEYLHRDGNHFWSSHNDLVTPFLAFDQFEEFFTLGRETSECATRATAFISELADLVENRPPAALRNDPLRAKEFSLKRAPLKVLLAVREDYLAELDRIRSYFCALGQNRLRLQPMGERQARQVIALGAALLAPGVADRILKFVVGDDDDGEITIAPALLSLVLRELNERRLARGPDAKITPDLLDVEQQKIFEDFYLRTIQDLPVGVRTFIEDKLLTTTGYRDSCALDAALSCPDVTQPILNELVNRRLLAYEDRHRTRRVELTHDVLIPVIKTSRDTRITREAVAQAELRARLAQEEKERQERELAAAQRAEEAEKREKEQKEVASKLRRLAWMLTLVAVMAAAAAIFGVAAAIFGSLQEKEARRQALLATRAEQAATEQARVATALRLALQSSDLLDKDLKLSLLLAVEAVRMGSVNQIPVAAEQALRAAVGKLGGSLVGRSGAEITALAISPGGRRVLTASKDKTARLLDPESAKLLLTLIGHTDLLDSARFSPDGRLLVTASWDATARLWDAATGQAIAVMRHDGPVYSAQFSPDARRVVTASGDKTARLWDAATRKEIGEPMRHDGPVYSAQFSPDGRLVVTASEDKTARLWDAATAKPIGGLMQHKGPVYSAQFSPDERWAMTTSADGAVRLWLLTAKGPEPPPIVFHGVSGPLKVVAIRSDNRWCIAASSDGTAQLWDLTAADPTAKPVVLRGHTGPIDVVAISLDAHWLVTGSFHHAATLWDLTAKDPAANPVELPANQGGVRAAAVSPNNRWLVTGGTDGSVRLWFIETSDLIEQARIAVGRNLTANEWALYFPGAPYHKTFPEL
jgi:WD40 repeat protein